MAERLTDAAIAEMEAWATADPVPPCRVCGAALTYGAVGGGGATIWGCPHGAAEARARYPEPGRWAHYEQSRHVQERSGHPAVRRLIAALRQSRAREHELRAACEAAASVADAAWTCPRCWGPDVCPEHLASLGRAMDAIRAALAAAPAPAADAE